MKALVLASGSGTRLRPLSHPSTNQLAAVANQPTGTVGDGSRFGIPVTYLPQHRPLGPARALLTAHRIRS